MTKHMLTWSSACNDRSSVVSTVRRDKVMIVSCPLTLEMEMNDSSCHVRIDGEGCSSLQAAGLGRRWQEGGRALAEDMTAFDYRLWSPRLEDLPR